MNRDLLAEEFKHQKALHKVGRGNSLSRRQMETIKMRQRRNEERSTAKTRF